MRRLAGPLRDWIWRHIPTREGLAQSRWIAPFAHMVLRAELWRFTRRSVPRAVALGLFVGILVPFLHSFIVPLLAFFVGANIPLAVATTWLSNPFTWMVMWPVAYRIGHLMLHVDRVISAGPVAGMIVDSGHGHSHMLHRLGGMGVEAAFGLFVEASVLASLGYLAASFGWRWWIARKWRRRHGRHLAPVRALA